MSPPARLTSMPSFSRRALAGSVRWGTAAKAAAAELVHSLRALAAAATHAATEDKKWQCQEQGCRGRQKGAPLLPTVGTLWLAALPGCGSGGLPFQGSGVIGRDSSPGGEPVGGRAADPGHGLCAYFTVNHAHKLWRPSLEVGRIPQQGPIHRLQVGTAHPTREQPLVGVADWDGKVADLGFRLAVAGQLSGATVKWARRCLLLRAVRPQAQGRWQMVADCEDRTGIGLTRRDHMDGKGLGWRPGIRARAPCQPRQAAAFVVRRPGACGGGGGTPSRSCRSEQQKQQPARTQARAQEHRRVEAAVQCSRGGVSNVAGHLHSAAARGGVPEVPRFTYR